MAKNKVGFAMFCLIHAALGYRYGRRNNKGENLTDEFFKLALYRDFVARPSHEYADAVLDHVAHSGFDLIRLKQAFKRITLSAPRAKPLRTYFGDYKGKPEFFRKRHALIEKQLIAVGVTPARHPPLNTRRG